MIHLPQHLVEPHHAEGRANKAPGLENPGYQVVKGFSYKTLCHCSYGFAKTCQGQGKQGDPDQDKGDELRPDD